MKKAMTENNDKRKDSIHERNEPVDAIEGDYSDYPPEGYTPEWDEYAIRLDGMEVPTFQISATDGLLAVEVDVAGISRYVPLKTDVEYDIETPEETFVGTLSTVQFEEGGATLWFRPLEEPNPFSDLDTIEIEISIDDEIVTAEEFHHRNLLTKEEIESSVMELVEVQTRLALANIINAYQAHREGDASDR